MFILQLVREPVISELILTSLLFDSNLLHYYLFKRFFPLIDQNYCPMQNRQKANW